MKHTIILTSIDFLRAILYLQLRNKFLWFLYFIPGSINYLVGYVGVWSIGFPIEETIQNTIDMVVWIIFLNIFVFTLTASSFLLNPKWRKGRIGKHEIQITETGLIEETEYNKTEIKWPSISKIKESNNMLFIKFGGSDLIVIPRRCFDSTDNWKTFNKEIISKWNKALS